MLKQGLLVEGFAARLCFLKRETGKDMLLSQLRYAVRSDVISPHIGNDMGLISGKDMVPGTCL